MPISAELIGSAFVMGLAGSFHCIGMCGPLALALPVSHKNDLSRVTGGLLYNSGRIFSYSVLGLLFGSLGSFMFAAKWQSFLSITLGSLILIYLLFPKRWFHYSVKNSLSKPFLFLRQQLGKLFQEKKISSIFFIGVLNGYLPCGLVYLALASSVVAGNSLTGGMFMLFFGLGTLPMMFSVVFMGNYLSQSLRQKIRGSIPFLLFIMAVLLILRGMNLGIPFISPGINDEHQSHVAGCH